MHDYEKIQNLLDSADVETRCNDPAKAADLYAAAAQHAESLSYFGPDHEETLKIRDFWAVSMMEVENHLAAILINDESLQRHLAKSSGEDQKQTLEIRRRLAESYFKTNQQEKAIEQLQKVIKTDESQGDRISLFEDVRTLIVDLFDWGMATRDRKKMSEAFEISMKYLTKAERELPGDHEMVLDFYYNTGFLLGQLGEHQEAIKWFEQVIKTIMSSGTDTSSSKLLEDSERQRRICLKLVQDRDSKKKAEQAHYQQKICPPVPRLEFSSSDDDTKQQTPYTSNDKKEFQQPAFMDVDVNERLAMIETLFKNGHEPLDQGRSTEPSGKASRRRSVSPASASSARRADEGNLNIAKTSKSKRSSSVGSGLPQSALHAGVQRRSPETILTYDSEQWFTHLQQNAHKLLQRYDRSGDEVKIALLDTGVALLNHSEIEISKEIKNELLAQVDKGKKLVNGLPPNKDIDGHGSDCAYLLTRACPFARVVSYRVVETWEDDIEPTIVAEALRDAIYVRKVNIISMSFGCKDPKREISNLLYEARRSGILMFAASSNDGGNIRFPASSDHVFAIDAAERTGGQFSGTAAASIQKPHRFTALGKILSVTGTLEGSKRKREERVGSSFATPIAASTAAIILEFANQPPLCHERPALDSLKRMEGMRSVLTQLLSNRKFAVSEFYHINIEHFEHMNGKDGWDDGGEWFDGHSDRYKAADQICKVLDDPWLGEDIGKSMREIAKTEDRNRERGQLKRGLVRLMMEWGVLPS